MKGISKMNLTNVQAMQIFSHLYNVRHRSDTDENCTFYPERFVEVLDLKFDDDQIIDLLNLAKGLSYRKAAKVSDRKISHVTMKSFEYDAACILNTSRYFRHFFKQEYDDYDFRTSTIETLKDEINSRDLYFMIEEVKRMYGLDVEKFKDFRFFVRYQKREFNDYLKFLASLSAINCDLDLDLDQDIIRLENDLQTNLTSEQIDKNWTTILSFRLKEIEARFEKEPMTIEDITRLVELVMNDRSAKIYLFGSHARNQASAKSDIDLIVDSSDALLTLDIMGAIEEIVGDDKNFKCQAITMKQLSKADEEFRKSVETDMVLIYDK